MFTTASGNVYGGLGNISSHPVNLIGKFEFNGCNFCVRFKRDSAIWFLKLRFN